MEKKSKLLRTIHTKNTRVQKEKKKERLITLRCAFHFVLILFLLCVVDSYRACQNQKGKNFISFRKEYLFIIFIFNYHTGGHRAAHVADRVAKGAHQEARGSH